jgi:hypothetical protein
MASSACASPCYRRRLLDNVHIDECIELVMLVRCICHVYDGFGDLFIYVSPFRTPTVLGSGIGKVSTQAGFPPIFIVSGPCIKGSSAARAHLLQNTR